MATPQTVPHPQSKAAVPAVPATFQAALQDGWKVVGEDSSTTPNELERTGVVFLERRGRRIEVSYSATLSGYTFDKPQLAA